MFDVRTKYESNEPVGTCQRCMEKERAHLFQKCSGWADFFFAYVLEDSKKKIKH